MAEPRTGADGRRVHPARRRWAEGLLAAVLFLVALVVAGTADAGGQHRIDIGGDAAWLVSDAVGQVALVDGASAEVITQVRVGRPGLPPGSLSTAQADLDAFVVDASTGTVGRISGATYVWDHRSGLLTAGDTAGLFVGSESLYLLDNRAGVVTTSDASTLSVRGRQSLAARVGTDGGVVDRAGRLWLVDTSTGDLVWFDGTTRHDRPRTADPTHSRLVLADGRPVLVNLVRRQVSPLSSNGAARPSTCLDVGAADSDVQIAGASDSDRVYAAVGSRGVLTIADLAARQCGSVIDLDAAGHELGAPVGLGDRVFVPDFTAGAVHVVDTAAGRKLVTRRVLAPRHQFSLTTQGDFVFYNDPAGSVAGVIRLDGSTAEVRKYGAERIGAGPGGTDVGDGASAGDNPPGSTPADGPGTGDVPRPTATPPGGAPTGRSPEPNPTRPPSDGAVLPSTPQTPVPQTPVPQTPRPANPGPGGGQTRPDPVLTTDPQPQQPRLTIEASTTSATVGQNVRLRVAGSGVVDASWVFGDDSPSSQGINTTHAWTAPGRYVISANVTLASGPVSVVNAGITVRAGPAPQQPTATGPTARVALTPATGEAPLAVRVDASASTAGSSPIDGYTIDFGDGTTAAGATATHTFARAGDFTVTVAVTDGAGLRSTASATAHVTTTAAGPIARLTTSSSQPTVPTDIVADASASTAGSASIASYTFAFSDGTTVGPQASATIHHSVTAAGTYTVNVTVRDQAGRSSTANAGTQVTAPARVPPTAALVFERAPAGGVGGYLYRLNASGSRPGSAPIVSYLFDFGDGEGDGPSTEPTSAYHEYLAGVHQASVTVTDQNGLRSTATTTLDGQASIALEKTVVASSSAGTTYSVTGTSRGAAILVRSVSGTGIHDDQCTGSRFDSVSGRPCTFQVDVPAGTASSVVTVVSNAQNSPTSIDVAK